MVCSQSLFPPVPKKHIHLLYFLIGCLKSLTSATYLHSEMQGKKDRVTVGEILAALRMWCSCQQSQYASYTPLRPLLSVATSPTYVGLHDGQRQCNVKLKLRIKPSIREFWSVGLPFHGDSFQGDAFHSCSTKALLPLLTLQLRPSWDDARKNHRIIES